MAKYGEENFTIDVIDTASDYDELKEKEKYWIKFYNSMDQNVGYNLTAGGDGTFGKKHSDETKEKIR
jgi:group I intron endonuclease